MNFLSSADLPIEWLLYCVVLSSLRWKTETIIVLPLLLITHMYAEIIGNTPHCLCIRLELFHPCFQYHLTIEFIMGTLKLPYSPRCVCRVKILPTVHSYKSSKKEKFEGSLPSSFIFLQHTH